MNLTNDLSKRINYYGETDELLKDICESYRIGTYISFEPILMGYEDVNIKLSTSKGNFFIKIFAESRDDAECLRLINIVKISIDNNVNHPEFLRHDDGYIFRKQYEHFNIRAGVFEFLDGKTFFELDKKPDTTELKEIIRMAAFENKISYEPKFLYDSWAILSLPQELEKSRKYLSNSDLKTMDKLLLGFEKIDIKGLPHSLVHGDLTGTNIMKSNNKIYFVDFSVANFYPRIIELAVLMCDVMFDPTNKTSVNDYYKLLLTEYQKYLKLTKEELDVLPLFIKIAHAMHVVRGTRAKIEEHNNSKENEHWIKQGKLGLKYTLQAWM